MVDLSFGLKTTSKLQDIQNAVNKRAKKILVNNVKKIDSIVEESINKAVRENQGDFIPDDREAGELGIGQDGRIDESKRDGAWKKLLITTRGQQAVTTFTILEQGGSRPDFARLFIVIDEELLYKDELSNVSIEPSKDNEAEQISNIPWMRWLIEGAPRNPLYRFRPSGLGRTGEGTMRKSGVWNFKPRRFGAFERLAENIEKTVRNNIKRNIGKVL